jgi:dihydroflavonol-4-reductase
MTFLAGKKILITGGTGHLGSALVHHLVQNLQLTPANIRIFYLADTPTQSLIDISGLDLFPGDILRLEDVRRACKGVDYVFHMAGSTTFDPQLKRRQWLINVEGTRHVLEAVRQSSSIKKMCYTSTVNVLDVPRPAWSIGNLENSDPYSNPPRLHAFSSPLETLDFADQVRQQPWIDWEKKIRIAYFDSKLAAQELVQRYVREFGLDVVSVLPGTSFGPYDFLIGNGIYLLLIYRGQMPGALKGGISAVHVMDVAEGHCLAMKKGQKGERYIITGAREDNLTFKDLFKMMADALQQQFPDKKIRAPLIVVPSWAANMGAFFSERYARLVGRPSLLSRAAVRAGSMPLFFSYEKAARELGYRPKRTVRQAIEDMAAYYRAQNLFEARGRQVDH